MAKDIDFFQKVLIERFGDMPTWVRVTSYLTALVLSVYLTLCPDYLHGKVMMPGLDGAEQGYREGQILVFYEDQPIAFELTEEGSFRVPVFSKLPWPPVELRVKRGKDHFPVRVPIMRRLAPGPINIYGQSDPWNFSLEPPSIPKITEGAESLLSSLGIGGTAFAQSPAASPQPTSSPETHRTVMDIVDEAHLAAGHREFSRTQALGADPVARSLVVGAIENAYDIAIPADDWSQLRSIRDIESYLASVGFDLRIRKILRDASGKEDLYLAPAIPSDKLANARVAAAVPDSEEIIGILDATIFGSAKESMVFGKRGIYYRTSFTRGEGPRVGHVSYDSFRGRDFRRAAFYEVSLGPDVGGGEEELRFVVAKTQMNAEELAGVLTRIRDARWRPPGSQ